MDHPFATRASVDTFHAMSWCAASGALSRAFFTMGSSLSKSRLLPGSMPIRFLCAMIGSSVMCGVQLQEFGRVGKVFGCRHGIDLNLRRRLHIDVRVYRHSH